MVSPLDLAALEAPAIGRDTSPAATAANGHPLSLSGLDEMADRIANVEEQRQARDRAAAAARAKRSMATR